jgi:hypothetical protein
MEKEKTRGAGIFLLLIFVFGGYLSVLWSTWKAIFGVCEFEVWSMFGVVLMPPLCNSGRVWFLFLELATRESAWRFLVLCMYVRSACMKLRCTWQGCFCCGGGLRGLRIPLFLLL